MLNVVPKPIAYTVKPMLWICMCAWEWPYAANIDGLPCSSKSHPYINMQV